MQKDYPIEEMCTSAKIFWAAFVVAWGVVIFFGFGRF